MSHFFPFSSFFKSFRENLFQSHLKQIEVAKHHSRLSFFYKCNCLSKSGETLTVAFENKIFLNMQNIGSPFTWNIHSGFCVAALPCSVRTWILALKVLPLPLQTWYLFYTIHVVRKLQSNTELLFLIARKWSFVGEKISQFW